MEINCSRINILPRPERGNALFLILIAVALFAALSYAITQSSRGGGNIDKEQAKLDAAVSELCTAHVDQAVMRLKITGGCSDSEISYEYNGNNVNADAPADKHCHVFDSAGAGETACGSYLIASSSCDVDALAPGEKCSDSDIVYVSDTLGSRLYTTIADQGSYNWGDGQAACSGIGEGWHVPDKDELNVLYENKNLGSLNGTFNEIDDMTFASVYWSSTPNGDGYGWHQSFAAGWQYNFSDWTVPKSVRCVRS